jgi:hypothetical protein
MLVDHGLSYEMLGLCCTENSSLRRCAQAISDIYKMIYVVDLLMLRLMSTLDDYSQYQAWPVRSACRVQRALQRLHMI